MTHRIDRTQAENDLTVAFYSELERAIATNTRTSNRATKRKQLEEQAAAIKPSGESDPQSPQDMLLASLAEQLGK